MSRHGRPLLLALVVAVTLGALPEEQLECEQAVSHLRDCCALSQADVCGDGCNPITLTLEESACIQARDCDELVADDVCGRVERLAATNDSSLDAGARIGVCP